MHLINLLGTSGITTQVNKNHDLHELSDSITQFRNASFGRKPALHYGVRGVYESRRRIRKHSISPEEIVSKATSIEFLGMKRDDAKQVSERVLVWRGVALLAKLNHLYYSSSRSLKTTTTTATTKG
tara:strand:- start:139 stop:516 length:378 start_codon:yes stop_codon:yes gene_type:complete